jgi:hypothetical protein
MPPGFPGAFFINTAGPLISINKRVAVAFIVYVHPVTLK